MEDQDEKQVEALEVSKPNTHKLDLDQSKLRL